MPYAEIVGVASFMPERVVSNREVIAKGDLPDGYISHMLRGVKERRFAWPEYSSAALAVRACEKLFESTGVSGRDIDLVLGHAMLTDVMGQGIAVEVQHRMGAERATIQNVDTGCTSFLSAMNIARAYIESGLAKTVLIATATNFVSRSPEQDKPQTLPLGDGAAAMLLTAGRRSILSSYEQVFGDVFGVMKMVPLRGGDDYWDVGTTSFRVQLTADVVETLTLRALEIVPAAVQKALEQAELTANDVDLLITHQPNYLFVDRWRERLKIQAPRVHDTLESYGNLFAGSIPITLADALERGRVKSGDVLAFGAFANAGDLVSAMVVRWV